MKTAFAAAIAAATLALSVLVVQPSRSQGTASNAEPVIEPYVPKIGEIMALQQMRHIKLWFAGRAGNWPLAGYEIDELKEGFSEVDRQLGGTIVESAVGRALSAVEKAIDAKDKGAFPTAFDGLSAGCNSCHQTLDRNFIVIMRPSSLPYTDQSFAVRK
jgi:hypothetical protein